MLRAILVFMLFAFCIVSLVVDSERIDFSNYRVYKLNPKSLEEMEVLRDLDGASDSLFFLNAVEIPNRVVNVVVAPHTESDFVQWTNETGIAAELIENNIQKHLESEQAINVRSSKEYNWRSYYSLEETYTWMQTLQKQYPQVELLVAGRSYEGREIRGVKLSYKPDNKVIVLEGGIHAREWISSSTVTYILNELLTSQNANIRYLAENFNWYVFPHINPDGYVYTWERNRMWRKTRSRNGLCRGVDPNRNWDSKWAAVGVSRNPCAENFPGRSAFSEIEVKTYSNFIRSLKNVRTYLSFHAFSQMLLFPYGYKKSHGWNHHHLKKVGQAATNALAKRYGKRYTVGTIYEIIYPASGSSVDWVYDTLKIPLAYTYELRPRQQDSWRGFILPASEIIETGQETMDSVEALVQEANKLGYYN